MFMKLRFPFSIATWCSNNATIINHAWYGIKSRLLQFTEKLHIPRWLTYFYGMMNALYAHTYTWYFGQAYSNHEACFITYMIWFRHSNSLILWYSFMLGKRTLLVYQKKPQNVTFTKEYWNSECNFLGFWWIPENATHSIKRFLNCPMQTEVFACVARKQLPFIYVKKILFLQHQYSLK